jgi:hypothetical protein
MMFDVRPTCIYRHLCYLYTRKFAVADRGNAIIKVVMLQRKVVGIIANSELVKSELVRFHCSLER